MTTEEVTKLYDNLGLGQGDDPPDMAELKAILQRGALIGGLHALHQIQVPVSRRVGAVPQDDVSSDLWRTYGLATIVEIVELLQETTGWKPWKGKKEIDRGRVLDEFADVIAFFGLLMKYVMIETGASFDEVADAYLAKTKVNHARLSGKVEGYEINGQ